MVRFRHWFLLMKLRVFIAICSWAILGLGLLVLGLPIERGLKFEILFYMFLPSSLLFWVFPIVGYFVVVAQWPIIGWLILRAKNASPPAQTPPPSLR